MTGIRRCAYVAFEVSVDGGGALNEPLPLIALELCDGYPVDQVGAKAATLARLGRAGLSVPAGFCIPADVFAGLRDETGIGRRIDAELEGARAVPATLGAALARIRQMIRQLPRPSWLDGPMLEVLLDGGPVVVRSSAPAEDGPAGSAAGIYESVLDCGIAADVWAAMLTVWASLFSERVNYYRHGQFAMDMPVIVQHQIHGLRTGVLFSRHPLTGAAEPYLELSAAAEAVTSASGSVQTGAAPAAVRDVARVCEQIVGGDADIEIALGADEVIVLQARPTAHAEQTPVTGVRWALQEDVAAVRALPLGRCEQLFIRQLVKHVPYRQLCRSLHIPVYDVFYLAYRWDSLDRLPEFTRELATGRIQVRWGSDARASAHRADLAAVLRDGRMHNVVGDSTSCAQIGAVVAASASGISARTVAGSTVVEAFPAQAKGVKSGRVVPSTYVLDKSGSVLDAAVEGVTLDPDPLRELARITGAVSDRLGEVRLEWYLAPNGIIVKDLSIERNALSESTSVLSPGLADGPALLIRDLEELEAAEITDEVSVTEHGTYSALIESASPLRRLVQRIETLDRPPVVIAPYPSLGLVPLIPYTAGFVFGHGNLLSHMAIVLRERGIPGYVISSIFTEVEDGRQITVGPDGLQVR